MIDWTHMNPEVQPLYNSLVDQFGMPLPITSGFRDPAHNAKVGGAKGSQHLHGNALDIDASNLSQAQRLALISLAREQGFGGVGVYDNSLHFDVGDTRAWGPDYTSASIPEWARGVVNMGAGNVAIDPNNSNDGIAALDAFEMPASARWGRALGNIGDRLVAYGRREALPQQLSGDRMYDRQFAKKSRNHTAQWLQTNGYGDLANMVLAGQMSGKDAIAAIYGKGNDPYKAVGGKIFNTETGEWIEPPGSEGGTWTAEQLKTGGALRDDLDKRVQLYRDTRQSFQNINESVRNGYETSTGVDDVALVTNFAKFLDPGSVVRPEESRAVAEAGAYIPGLMAQIKNAAEGTGTLTPQMRQQIVEYARAVYVKRRKEAESIYSQYSGIATGGGIPLDILGKLQDPLYIAPPEGY